MPTKSFKSRKTYKSKRTTMSKKKSRKTTYKSKRTSMSKKRVGGAFGDFFRSKKSIEKRKQRKLREEPPPTSYSDLFPEPVAPVAPYVPSYVPPPPYYYKPINYNTHRNQIVAMIANKAKRERVEVNNALNKYNKEATTYHPGSVEPQYDPNYINLEKRVLNTYRREHPNFRIAQNALYNKQPPPPASSARMLNTYRRPNFNQQPPPASSARRFNLNGAPSVRPPVSWSINFRKNNIPEI